MCPHLSLAGRAMVRSQSGPLASVPITLLPIHRILRVGSRAVQSVVLETPPHASPPQCSRLPVWPSPRRHWPPPRSVQESWGAGQKGVRCRKCCRSNLQGRRRASVHKRHAAGLAHLPDVWKWWPNCSAGASLLWMPPSSLRCTEMVHTGGRRT